MYTCPRENCGNLLQEGEKICQPCRDADEAEAEAEAAAASAEREAEEKAVWEEEQAAQEQAEREATFAQPPDEPPF